MVLHYLITFLEGFISFISPCMLPMLPIYISYFAGSQETDNSRRTFINAFFFVIGFSFVYMILGMFAGTIGKLFMDYKVFINIVSGALVIFFGLSYLGVFKINLLKGMKATVKPQGIISSFIFGVVFSVSLTPCVGAFLGSALVLASGRGSWSEGILLLLVYSLGMGIPFLISAVLISKLKGSFNFIKKHYNVINIISGSFLIVVGISMAFGLLNKLLFLFGD